MFYSLSQYPGKTGEFYYNFFFKKFNLPYTYTALKCTNLKESVEYLKSNSALGFSVSMPFKEEILDYLDAVQPEAASYSTCNTVKVRNGELIGYNTDYYGALYLKSIIPYNAHIAVLGDGAMGRLIKRILGPNADIISRKKGNWEKRYNINDILINCTSFGTATHESPFYVLPPVKMVIDLAIKDNILKKQCADTGTPYISGLEFYKHQFIKQFEIYTDTRINTWDFENLKISS